MNSLLPFLYLTFFAIIAGGAFALMWSNIKFINEEMNRPKRTKHPEEPKPGDELLYVNLDRERLEKLYEQ
jgi:hypothetical protein